MQANKKQQPRVDRRVQRTHIALHEALVALTLEKGWDNVSVLDVCERADVGRSTFYTHFADREDLLLSGFEHLKGFLRDARSRSDDDALLRFVHPLIVHAGENRRLFRALVGKKAGQVIIRRFREVVFEMTREELPARGSDEQRHATALFLSGGICELLTWWLDGRTGTSADDVDAVVQQLCRRAVG